MPPKPEKRYICLICINNFYKISVARSIMTNNILGLNVTSNRFYDAAYIELSRAFNTVDPDLIEIEFKYAELRSLLPYQQEKFRDIPRQIRNMLESASTDATHEVLKSMSTQNVLYLNPLGSKSYNVMAGFNQKAYKKFYHIREMLLKVSDFNKKNNYKRVKPRQNPMHIYHELSLNNSNHELKVIQDNELRLDLLVRGSAPQHLQGRYSYTSKQGWIKTIKEKQCLQLDYMLSEKYYRMAVNKQINEQPDFQTLQELSKFSKELQKPYDIRLKRSLRVVKNGAYQISLSEIITINDLVKCQEIGELIFQTNSLEDYIKKMFISFYQVENGDDSVSWEIQLEFVKEMNRNLKEFISERKYGKVQNILETSMGELHSLFFTDHAVKTKEVAWLNRHLSKDETKGRLDHEFGTYMRELLYKKMERINNGEEDL